MKDHILKSILFSLSISFGIYLCAVYYKWDFFNPFEYLAGMPLWSGPKRAAIAFSILCYLLGNLSLYVSIWSKPPAKKDEIETPYLSFAVFGYILSACLAAGSNC